MYENIQIFRTINSILFLFRFLHLHTQTKVTGGHTDVRGHPLAKIESQGSRISSRSGSEESPSEAKTKSATFGVFRKR